MARYTDEYQGIHVRTDYAAGADPNYRGGVYRGQRMYGRGGQAEYGRYRLAHADELGGEGGFQGRLRQIRDYAGDYQRSGRTGYDWGMRGGGGVHDPRYDREHLRDFNANTPALRSFAGYRGVDYTRGGSHPAGRYDTFRWRYANRGLTSSGFSEQWARGPMRGSRER